MHRDVDLAPGDEAAVGRAVAEAKGGEQLNGRLREGATFGRGELLVGGIGTRVAAEEAEIALHQAA